MFKLRIILPIFNLLYKHFYKAYRPLYNLYKRLTNRMLLSNIKNLIQPNSVILDIGANIGFYSLFFSKFISNKGLVIAFEPDETNFTHLQASTKNIENIQIFKYAISDSTDEINLYLSNKMNVDHHTYDDGENRESIKVQSISIDDFLKIYYPQLTVDFIKIDIQGFDYFALLGMKKTILKTDNLVIVGEYWPYGLQMAKIDPLKYYNALIDLGFLVSFIPPMSISEIVKKKNNPTFEVDFVAIKESASFPKKMTV